MTSEDSLSRRLAGLYCLYCLYETQPFKPPFKIYVSLGDLKKLKNLIVDAKEQCVLVVLAIVNRMLEKNVFLFGSVDLNEGSACSVVNQLTEWQDTCIQVAYDKLFHDTRIEQFLHMDMGMEFDLDVLKKMSTEYAYAKKQAIGEALEVVDVQNIQHISDDKEVIGDVVEKMAENWNAQRELFYRQTRVNQHLAEEGEPQHHQNPELQDDADAADFSRDLELQLFEEEPEQGETTGIEFSK